MPEIALVNQDGLTVGAKPRAQLTADDTYHSIFVLVITKQRQLVLSAIGGGRLSATAVTLCQKDESPTDAALRAAKTARTAARLHHLGDQFYTAPTGRKSYMSVFYGVGNVADDAKNCERLTATQLDERAKACTPALQFVWSAYRHLLPV